MLKSLFTLIFGDVSKIPINKNTFFNNNKYLFININKNIYKKIYSI